MNNKENNHQEFTIEQVFEVSICKSTDFGHLEKGKTPFIGRTKSNNGLQGYVTDGTINKGNCITIGMVGTIRAFWQTEDFVASQNLLALRNPNINSINAAYICTLLNFMLATKHSYNRPLQKNKFVKEKIPLPITKQNEPDFIYMEQYIKSLRWKPITTTIQNCPLSLNTNEWKEFKLKDIFELKKGKRLTKADMVSGQINYLGAIAENNGVRQRIDIDKTQTYPANCITVNYNGSVGEAFYQAEPFWASDDVNVLYPKHWTMNKYHALFIITVIKANQYRFSYGRKWTLEKMKESIIQLPSQKTGIPDFDYMENYIKKLSYSDRI